MAPLLLEEDEAVAVAVGLRAAANGGVPGFEDTTLRALTKVIALMPPRLRRRMGALQTQTEGMPWSGGPVLDPAVLTTLAQACRDDEVVSFGYTAADGSGTTRRVEPHRLVNLGRRWYLAAWDRDRGDWRSFRVDRIAEPPATSGQRFRPREIPGGDAAAYVSRGLRNRPRKHRVVVESRRAGRDRRGGGGPVGGGHRARRGPVPDDDGHRHPGLAGAGARRAGLQVHRRGPGRA
ncbi:WYL domain-containing protein [Nocardioides convexus]|uniref:helix-turn-helix transcriptional regulator n=1 Tax=Nocardioides convexus TaxID=2712224 RepID=UPI00241838B6|nr:WYL domain-containing protein [Nocardioides convexus]